MDNRAMLIPAKPIMDPTDKSNSPAIISKHAPTAIIMNCDETIDQFNTPEGENMPESPAERKKKKKTKIVPQIPPSSGRISAWRKVDLCLIRSSSAGGIASV
jgi:hypothetical protein